MKRILAVAALAMMSSLAFAGNDGGVARNNSGQDPVVAPPTCPMNYQAVWDYGYNEWVCQYVNPNAGNGHG